ncbi:hypothetical protein GCM10010174_82480 [Kutzneria viridogrisea]|uniref:Uncharacterized protein n=1 Tax=Kutzneria viridogrisea TaxID=47990 RepID=A0ABR6BEK7_9PSEU|nr:hypothetical protein [Kutzneria viridogrisea]
MAGDAELGAEFGPGGADGVGGAGGEEGVVEDLFEEFGDEGAGLADDVDAEEGLAAGVGWGIWGGGDFGGDEGEEVGAQGIEVMVHEAAPGGVGSSGGGFVEGDGAERVRDRIGEVPGGGVRRETSRFMPVYSGIPSGIRQFS